MVSQRLSRTSTLQSYRLLSISRVTRRVFNGGGTVAGLGAAAGFAGAAGVWIRLAANPVPVIIPTATALALLRTKKSRRVSSGFSFGLSAPVATGHSGSALGGALVSAMGISCLKLRGERVHRHE